MEKENGWCKIERRRKNSVGWRGEGRVVKVGKEV